MKRLALLLPLLALAAGCTTYRVRVLDETGRPVPDAVVVQETREWRGCGLSFPFQTGWIVTATDAEGVAVVSDSSSRNGVNWLWAFSPDFFRYCIPRWEDIDVRKTGELRLSKPVDLGFDEKGRFADPRLVAEISFSRQLTPPDGKIEVDWKRNPGREDLAGKLRAFFDRIDAAETAARALRPPPSETGSFRLDGIPGGAEKTGPQWKELLTERGVEWPEDSWVGKARCAPGILCVRNTQGNLAKVRDILDSLRSEHPATNSPAASDSHAENAESAETDLHAEDAE